jgi:hypothetical protein
MTAHADKELNKQAENILKVFATSTDAGGGRATELSSSLSAPFISSPFTC